MERKILYITIIALIISVVFFQGFSAWAVPGLIYYQGKFTDSDGELLNGDYDMTFSLYKVVNGGTPLWTEIQQSVKITDGFLNVDLGAKEGFPEGLFNNDELYLEITIKENITGLEETLSPRQRFTSTPYSMKSADADTLDGMDSTDFVSAGHANSKNTHGVSGAIVGTTDNQILINKHISGEQIDSGKIDNARLNMGEGSNLDADTVDGKHASEFGNGHSLDAADGRPTNVVYVDNEGNVGIGTDNPEERLEVNGRIKDKTGFVMPVGTILAYGGAQVPDGWLLCDGNAVSRTAYEDLFSAIGIAWGSGDGSTTFNLPDLRGMFLRGVDGDRGIDPDKNGRSASKQGGNDGNKIGSIQDDAFQGHRHRWAYRDRASKGESRGIGWSTSKSREAVHEPTALGGYGTPRISSETRPQNIYVNFIIKY